MYPVLEYFSELKKQKTPDAANKVIRFMRMNWQPLISQAEAEYGMAYLLGAQSLAPIKSLFQNTTRLNLQNVNPAMNNLGLVNAYNQPLNQGVHHEEFLQREMTGVPFKSLPVLEKWRNIITAEMKKMGPIVNVRSEDPTSTSKKIRDRGLLEHKNEIEGLLSYVYSSIGQQPYRLKDHKIRFNEKPDAGNTEDFEAMGMNSQDPSDVNFFMENFHKLDEEIAVQSVVDYISTYNQWLLDIEKWVTDIMAKKSVAATCYVSDVTGAIMTRYLAPETVWIYGGGNRKDYNDALAKGYERKVSIKEMLDILGNSFDMEAQFNNLLLAVTNTMNIEFTGIRPSYRGFVGGDQVLGGLNGINYNYNQFLTFKVTLGYIEWVWQNQLTFEEIKKGDEFYENNQSPDGKYPKNARWETPTYKSYYLAISQVEQIMFDFGEVTYQDIEGYSDFNVNYTIVTYKEIGDPIAVIAAPFIDLMNEAWYKFRYEIRRAKPRGRGWNYDSMISTMMEMIPDTNISSFNKLQKVMEMLDSSANEIYKFPIGQDGKEVLFPGNQLNYDIPNGLSKESLEWWNIIESVNRYLADLIGIAPLREGDPGSPRDSMNNQFKALESSMGATYYVPDMLTYLFQQLSVKANFYAQDIILYKKYNTIAYKFLEDAVGEDTINKIWNLGHTGMHRFGIFVESLNQAPLRQKMEAVLFEAVKNKTITTAEYLLINDIKSVKKAFLTFAYFEQRNRKIAEKFAQQQQQAQTDAMLQVEAAKQKTIQMEGEYMLAGKRIDAEASQNEKLIIQQGQLDKQAMKHTQDVEQIYYKAVADLHAMMGSLNETGKTTIPPPPPPAGPVAGYAPPQSISQAQQLRENAMPQNTGATLQ